MCESNMSEAAPVWEGLLQPGSQFGGSPPDRHELNRQLGTMKASSMQFFHGQSVLHLCKVFKLTVDFELRPHIARFSRQTR